MTLHLVQLVPDSAALVSFAYRAGLPRDDPGYLWHRALRDAFGMLAPQPFRSLDPGAQPVHLLGYAPPDKDRLREAMALAAPDLDRVFPPERIRSKKLPLPFGVGRRLAFETRVCPLVRTKSEDGTRQRELDAFVHHALTMASEARPEREPVYRAWLADRLTAAGGRLVAARMTSFRLGPLVRRRHASPSARTATEDEPAGARSRAFRLPRSRGDGPTLGGALTVFPLAPPLARRWTPHCPDHGAMVRGSPARAAMDPARPSRSTIWTLLPRSREDCPRGRGPRQREGGGSPPRGMDRRGPNTTDRVGRLAHPRGTGLGRACELYPIVLGPPPMWGWTQGLELLDQHAPGSPAHAARTASCSMSGWSSMAYFLPRRARGASSLADHHPAAHGGRCRRRRVRVRAPVRGAGRGIEIPEQLSVVGFSDLDVAEQMGLTTMRTPKQESGDAAAAYLLERLPEGEPPRCIELSTRFCLRQSSSPAPEVDASASGVRGRRRRAVPYSGLL
jgi:hypothetical protein